MNRNKELLRNIFIFGIGTLGSKLIQFLLIPLYSIYLSTTEYSISDTLTSTISLITPLLTIGITDGVLRFTIGQVSHRKSILKFSLAVCFVGTVLLALFIPIFSRLTNLFGDYGYLIPVLYFTSSIKTMLAQYCKAIEKNVTYALDGIICSLTLTVGSILLIGHFKMGIMGYVLANIVSRSISIIYFTIICKIPSTLYGAKIDRNLTKELINYSLPLMPNNLSWWIIQMSDRYMLIFFCGAAINGLYSMAYKIPSIFNLIVSIFISAFGITAMKECDAKTGDQKYDGKYFENIYAQYLSLTFVAVVIIILLSRPIAFIILKKEFYNSWVYIPLLLCAYAIGNLQSFYGTIYGGIKKSRLVFISTLSGAITNIVLNVVLIPFIDAYGAAIATITSYFVVYVIRVHNIKKYVEMNHFERKVLVSIALMLAASILYIHGNIFTIIMSMCLSFIMFVLYWIEIKKLFLVIIRKISRIGG